MRQTITLRSGTLTLDVEQADIPLEELCGFGTRRSRKRGFLIVSKVLGKHIPVDPLRMEWTHRRLAEKLARADVPGPVVVIAMAETATALGQGVFEQFLAHTGRDDVLVLHTTRYRLDRPLALTCDESHSHATEHLLYMPSESEDANLFVTARSLILVDDEISSGRTLANLAREYLRRNPALEAVHLVCLTDWTGDVRRRQLGEELQRPVRFHHLLRGSLHFEPAENFDPGPIPDVSGKGNLKDAILPSRGGRHGVRRALKIDVPTFLKAADVGPAERVLVLGTGEFSYAPYRLALALRKHKHQVVYQSTTRSPMLPGEDMGGVLEFVDNYGDDIPNYVYNVAGRRYDQVIIGYETHPLPTSHRLPEMLGARAIYFGSEGGG